MEIKTCLIEGCGKPARNRGWCEAHYARWRHHGDPLRGGNLRARASLGEPARYLMEVVLKHQGPECLIWPFGRTGGYGRIGRRGLVHRIVCEAVHGPPPTPQHEAAHSCGRGHDGCVSRTHLSWKTPKENSADRVLHGTAPCGEQNGYAKLTAADLVAIRSALAAGNTTQRQIAAQFGVSHGTISLIRHGRTWIVPTATHTEFVGAA